MRISRPSINYTIYQIFIYPYKDIFYSMYSCCREEYDDFCVTTSNQSGLSLTRFSCNARGWSAIIFSHYSKFTYFWRKIALVFLFVIQIIYNKKWHCSLLASCKRNRPLGSLYGDTQQLWAACCQLLNNAGAERSRVINSNQFRDTPARLQCDARQFIQVQEQRI